MTGDLPTGFLPSPRACGRPASGRPAWMLALSAFATTTVAIGLATPVALAADDPMAASQADQWPLARGSVEGTGRSATILAFPLEEVWRRTLEKTAIEATPIIARGTIYVGDLDGSFHALALDSGTTRWSFKGEAGFSAAAAFVPLDGSAADGAAADGPAALVVAGDALGVIRGFDARTGDIVWKHERDGEISGGPSVVVGDGSKGGPRILVGSQDASLVCLSAATGAELWKHSIADQIRCMPTVVAGRVLIAGCDGRLHAIDVETGRPAGDVAIDGPTGTTPAALGTTVYFGSEGGSFYGIDIGRTADSPPTIRWRKTPAGGGQSYRSSAAVAEGPSGPVAIVGLRGRAVEAFAAADGGRVWRAAMRGKVDASPIVVRIADSPSTAAIVADAAGRIAALRPQDGSAIWEFDAGSGFAASPAAAEGRLVLAAEDGTVWCFGPKK